MNHKAIIFHSRMVGLTYLVTTLIGLFNNFYVKPRIFNPETLLDSEMWFRSAQVLDLTMFALVLWMALAIFLSIRHVSATLAKFVLAFRVTEVIIGCVVVMVTYMGIFALKLNGSPSAFSEAQMHSLHTLSLELANIGWAIHLCFLAVGALIYFYLLYWCKGIPRWLCYWGLFTYITVFIGFFLKLLLPSVPQSLMIVMAPGALFEFIFGCWMLAKGINLQTQPGAPSPQATAEPASATTSR